MRKTTLLPLAAGLLLAIGCDKEVLHETVVEYIDEEVYDDFGFYRRADMALVEVTLPEDSPSSDDVYLVGAFNGGEEAVGNSLYRLTPSSRLSGRYGVYLDPDNYLDGKTPADGFWFVSGKEGREVSAEGADVTHTDAVGVAQRLEVMVAAWETRFIPKDENVTHDGPVVYVKDHTGWESLTLSVSGTELKPGGTCSILGGKWKWFDLGADKEGTETDLVFGNGSSSLPAVHVTLEYNLYYNLTETEAVETSAFPEHAGIRVWVDDRTGWNATAMYLFGDVNDLGGVWPGIRPGGKLSYKGYEYTMFAVHSSAFGLNEQIIFNNNGEGTQLEKHPVSFTAGTPDYFYLITPMGTAEVDPEQRNGTEIDIEPTDHWCLYIKNETSWDGVNVYFWGDGYVPLAWPGILLTDDLAVELEGNTWYRIEAPGLAAGRELSFIFSKPVDVQEDRVRFDGWFTLDSDKYIVLRDTAAETEIVEDPSPRYSMYILDETEWDNLYVHYWATDYVPREWPGTLLTEEDKVEKYDKTWYKFDFLKDDTGKLLTFYFFYDPSLPKDTRVRADEFFTLNSDKYVRLTSSTVKEIDPEEEVVDNTVTLYVDNGISIWQEAGLFYLYVYGGTLGNDYTGAWPGRAFERTVEKDDTTWYVFTIPDGLNGTCKLQFSNDAVQPKTRIKTPSEITLDAKEMYIRLEEGNTAPVIL